MKQINKILCVVLLTFLILGCVGCTEVTEDPTSIDASMGDISGSDTNPDTGLLASDSNEVSIDVVEE
jgi:predicted component of type VI protein secretion system